MKREELLESREYWISKIQIDLFEMISAYMKDNHLNQTQLAEKLGVSKGYVSQILNGNFDHKISKLVDLSLALGSVPVLQYQNINLYIEEDKIKYMVNANLKETSLNIPRLYNPENYLIQRIAKNDIHSFIVSKEVMVNSDFNIDTEDAMNNATTIKLYHN